MMLGDDAVAVWREAFEVFERLSESEPDSRARELETLEHTRPELHPHLVGLFAEYDLAQAESPLTRNLASAAGAAAAAGAMQTGMALGPYTLERLLGEGGMGEVWLARRADGRYQGEVAVKTLHPHLASAGVRARFKREGQIVAKLSHPNIARLYDAGASAEGLLYLVLEYVQGERIDLWCDQHKLDIAARLRLFLGVCEAVTQAHIQLIVHRDLKPSNILVTAEGQVKLLDFGIAKLIEADTQVAAQTELTRLGGRALTPEYAAPEQVLGQAITTVTDVYSLGVLLYLLLSGSRPYGGGGATQAQLEQSVVAAEPMPLAAASGRKDAPDGSSPPDRAERRNTTPARLRKALAGDLENIVGKALRKDPAQRYSSVQSLAEDLRRHLEHQPVQARPDAFGYRAAKFLRRHRGGVAAAAVVVLAIATGVTGVAWQANVARHRAAQLRTVVDFQSAMLEHVNVYQLGSAWLERERHKITDHLQQDHPLPPDQEKTSLEGFDRLLPLSQPSEVARETLGEYLLEPARAEVERRFTADPAVAGRLHDSLGQAYQNLGLYPAAIREFQSAMRAESAIGAEAPDTLSSQLLLAIAQKDGGDFPAAEATARAVVDSRSRTLGSWHADTLEAQGVLASVLTARRDFGAARKIEDEILPRIRQMFGADAPQTLQAESELAATMVEQSQYAPAQALQTHVLQTRRRQLGPEHPDTLAVLLDLLRTLRLQDKFAESRDRALEYLEIARRTQGEDDPRTLHAEAALANAYAMLNDFRAASQIEERLIEKFSRQLGEENPHTLDIMHNHAITLECLGDNEGARRLEEKVLASNRRVRGEGNEQTLNSMFTLAEALEKLGEYQEALKWVQTAYDGQLKLLGVEHDLTVASEARLASVLLNLHRLAQARPLAEQALEISQRTAGPDDETTIVAGNALAGILAAQGDYAQAAKLARQALDGQQHSLAPDDPSVAQTQRDLAEYTRHLNSR